MFLVQLKFADRSQAARHMEEHNAWIARGFAEGVFLLLGSLKPNQGGIVVAHKTSLSELKQRVDSDPFVAHGVVSAEIVEIAPTRADERLGFLLA
jgi:uncharacterized protein YciI